jgi:hypothetical protein
MASNRLVLINTGDSSTGSLKVSAYENSGQLIAERNVSLPAFSGFSGSIADLIPDLLTFDGYAVIEADSGSAQDALIGFETYRKGSDIAALRAIPDTERLQTGYLPQFGNQAGTASTVVLINPASVSQTVTATAAIMDVDGGNTTLKTVQEMLAPNQRLQTPLDQLFGFSSATSIAGYVRFQTLDAPGVFGYLQSEAAGGGLTAVPAQESGYSDVLFSHIANGPGSYTGVTLMNAGGESSSVTIDAFDSQGSATGSATLTLAPNTEWSGLLSALLPATNGQVGGRVHITASAPILATQIWGSASTAALAAMPTVKALVPSQPKLGIQLPPGPNQPPPGRNQPPPALNQPPAVNAGANQTITLPAYATLTGSATDDGLPNGSLMAQWSVVSGPGTVTFGNASALTTTATFPAAGSYTLELTVSDGQLLLSSTTTVTVNAVVGPVIGAGANTTVTLPSSATLAATVTDPCQPNCSLTTTWTVASGPGPVNFANPAALSTTATFSMPGTYVLLLTAGDGILNSSSSTTVTVDACGTTISGTVTLTANVTSSVGIAGVQFQVDGGNLGPQLTTTPYSLTWVTTAAANGCHAITATAQDVNDNTGTTTVNVFVNNP